MKPRESLSKPENNFLIRFHLNSRLLILRSTEEGENAPSHAKSKASPSDMPRESTMTKASDSCMEKNLSMDTRLSDMDSNLGGWEGGLATWSPSAWIAQAQVSETRMAKAQAWETLALEAQARVTLQPKPSVTELSTVITLKQESSQFMTRMSKKGSEGFPPRPLWSSKAEYILALMGYVLMPSGLLRFVSYWVHRGNCKSGSQDARTHKGQQE